MLCNKIPYPEKDGGVIAINAIAEGLLSAGCEVKMLAMNTKKHFAEINTIPDKFRKERLLELVEVDTSVKPVGALKGLFSGKSYNISRFESEAFNQKLIQILQNGKYDIIHLEGLYLTPYLDSIRQNTDAPIILRTHNVEWQIWQKMASEEKSGLKKWYLKKLTKQLKEYEEKVVKLVDGIAAITGQDMEVFKIVGCKAPMVVIPFGMDLSKYNPQATKFPNSIFYIGALDWLPNLQGMEWFFKNVWIKIVGSFPSTQFHIAGRNMPKWLRNNTYKNTVSHGEVMDAKSFMQQYDIMLVPLLAGSGVRIKILEGMAFGKPIITTSVGIEGIACDFEKDVMVADTPKQFADAVNRCLSDDKLKQSLGNNARKFVAENYDITKTSSKLLAFYNECILKRK